MSDFSISANLTALNEGGWYHNTETGEYANFGITIWFLRANGYLPKASGPRAPASGYEIHYLASLTLAQAEAILKTHFWDPNHCEKLSSQALANKLFDLGVNQGPGTAAKLLQEAADTFPGEVLTVDGAIGPLSIARINALPDEDLLTMFREKAAAHYAEIAHNNSALADQLHGWLARLAK